MKQVKVYPKFKCDFCKKRSTLSVMIRHEKICYMNPDRVCRTCDGGGYTQNEFNELSTPCDDCINSKIARGIIPRPEIEE